jgi:hypothetical protein
MIAEILLLALTIAPSPGPLCSVGSVREDGTPGPRISGPTTGVEGLVRNTPVIVRATAVREVSRPGEQMSRMVFRVVEVLKGEQVPDSIDFAGYVHDADDYNPGPVPYAFRRNGNVGGSCYAYSYRIGAEYLLFLGRFEWGLTPYHSIFSPTNEQLRGPEDPWLRWVRERIPPNSGSRTSIRPPAAAGAVPAAGGVSI